MMDRPVLLIVRNPEEWGSNEFVTLFHEEGYDTRDVTVDPLSKAIYQIPQPFGVIGNSLGTHAQDSHLEYGE
jgi:hypothetical protein